MRVKIQQTRITPISRLVRSMNLPFFVPDAIQIEKYEITNDQISSENLFFSVSEVCLKKKAS